MSNAERQRRYVERLKARAAIPTGPEKLLLAEACQALEARFRSLGSGPADIANMLSPDLVAWCRDHKADAPVRSYELTEAKRARALKDAVAFAVKAVAKASPLVTESTDPFDQLTSQVHVLLKRDRWNRTDNTDDHRALGILFKRAQQHIRASVGPEPATASKKKAWKAQVEKRWQTWLTQCSRQPGYYTNGLSDKMVRIFMRAAPRSLSEARSIGKP